MTEDFSHITYDQVKHEYYPNGRFLRYGHVQHEWEFKVPPEEKRFRNNLQIDQYTITQARIKAEDDYQKYLNKQKSL